MEPSEGFSERIRNVQRRVARFWKKEDTGATSVQVLRDSLAELNRRYEELQQKEQELQHRYERLSSGRQVLESTRNWYRSLAQEVPVGYLVTDLSGVVREANGSAGRLIGVSPEVLKDKPFWTLVAEEERDELLALLDRARRGEVVSRWVGRVRPPHGAEPLSCAWTIAPLRTSDGLAVVFEDVTDELVERSALRRRAALLEHADEAIIEIAADGTVVAFNHAAEALYERASHQVVGRPLDELLGPADRAALAPLLERLQRGEPTRSFETHVDGQDGDPRHLLWSLAPMREDGYRPVGGAVRVRDVTAQRLAELRTRRERERVRSLVAERTLGDERARRRVAAELQLGLQQSLNLARMKLAGLSKIIGGCSLDEPVQAASRLIDEALQAVEDAAAALSPPVLHDLGFVPAVRWLADELLRDHHLAVAVEDDGRDKPLDEVQRVLLFEALRELLLNVALHSGADRARVQMHQDGGQLVLRVRDDGRGFDPASTDEGPGLLATRELLAHLGASLELRSAEGQGTVATITLPGTPGDASRAPS